MVTNGDCGSDDHDYHEDNDCDDNDCDDHDDHDDHECKGETGTGSMFCRSLS